MNYFKQAIKQLSREQRKILRNRIILYPDVFKEMTNFIPDHKEIFLFGQSISDDYYITAKICHEAKPQKTHCYVYVEYMVTLFECKIEDEERLVDALRAWGQIEAEIYIESESVTKEGVENVYEKKSNHNKGAAQEMFGLVRMYANNINAAVIFNTGMSAWFRAYLQSKEFADLADDSKAEAFDIFFELNEMLAGIDSKHLYD